jgi:hypothetical protein
MNGCCREISFQRGKKEKIKTNGERNAWQQGSHLPKGRSLAILLGEKSAKKVGGKKKGKMVKTFGSRAAISQRVRSLATLYD